jgi:imidazolonepropionase-like amidohydrolase
LLTAAGLSPLEAIALATSHAAALLNLQDRGVLAPGKLADLLIVDGQPDVTISDVERIVSVWHHGSQTRKTISDFYP